MNFLRNGDQKRTDKELAERAKSRYIRRKSNQVRRGFIATGFVKINEVRMTKTTKVRLRRNKMATTSSRSTSTHPKQIAVGAISEAIVPGGSHLLKGDYKQGALHLVLGIAASLALGPLALAAVKAHSLTKSTTGQGLLDDITE